MYMSLAFSDIKRLEVATIGDNSVVLNFRAGDRVDQASGEVVLVFRTEEEMWHSMELVQEQIQFLLENRTPKEDPAPPTEDKDDAAKTQS